MRYAVLLLALAMPAIAWMSNQHVFGPDNGTVSDMYPTLLAAAGYAFSIWGLIFVLDIVYAVWQVGVERQPMPAVRAPVALGFALTAAWMPVFSWGLFWLALLIIWSAWAALLWAAIKLVDSPARSGHHHWLATIPLPLHAGWLSLAIFLNTAQVVVAYRLLDTTSMLGWSLVLLSLAATMLLLINARLRGNRAFVLAVVWGLAALAQKQFDAGLAGGQVMACAALLLAAGLLAHAFMLRLRRS